MAHMFIINPLSGERMDKLFSTHPATENRIAALNARLAREMGRERFLAAVVAAVMMVVTAMRRAPERQNAGVQPVVACRPRWRAV